MTDATNGELDKVLVFAKLIGDESLQSCLNRLKYTDDNCDTETTIYTDFAPKSFYFIRKKNDEFRSNGGIIYHGSHDNGGDGGSPTFSVNLTPIKGWAIHT